jgi:hypothetical protein
MKANRLFRGLLTSFLALLTTVSASARSLRPEVLHAEAEKHGVVLSVDVVRADQGKIVLEAHLRNTTDLSFTLPGGRKEYGLSFRLEDSKGRTILDAEPREYTEEVRLLPPGGSYRWTIDLTTRALFVTSNEPFGEGFPVTGLRALPLADLAFVDLQVAQVVGEWTLEPEAVRIWLRPMLFSGLAPAEAAAPRSPRAAIFADLHRPTPVDPDTPRPLPYPGIPEKDDGRIRPLLYRPGAPIKTPAFVPGQLLVTFAPGVDRDQARDLVSEQGFELISDHLFGMRILLVGVPLEAEHAAARQLEELDEVVSAQVNGMVTIF